MKKTKGLFHRYLFFVLPLVILSVVMTGVVLTWTSYQHLFLKSRYYVYSLPH
ncbi:MAG: hypothetical protein SWE60_08520 [Thermodesulfobacteriota bacterium]|nr:hypothetical protein [Thermodesulfobacteriota bacterium]